MNPKKVTDEVLPVDPEENFQYSRFDQLNPGWWRKLGSLVAENEGEVFPQVWVLGDSIELPWFNRRLRLEPKTFDIFFDDGHEVQPTYQDGLVVLALLNFLSVSHRLPEVSGLVNEYHLTGGTTFFRGPHVMASVLVAQRFARNGSHLLDTGVKWGGQPADFGEFSISITIFPGLEWIVALWEEDDEFPARAQYLFDKNLEQIFQLDLIWAMGNVVAAKLLSE